MQLSRLVTSLPYRVSLIREVPTGTIFILHSRHCGIFDVIKLSPGIGKDRVHVQSSFLSLNGKFLDGRYNYFAFIRAGIFFNDLASIIIVKTKFLLRQLSRLSKKIKECMSHTV